MDKRMNQFPTTLSQPVMYAANGAQRGEANLADLIREGLAIISVIR
jgi:hypothetical protein